MCDGVAANDTDRFPKLGKAQITETLPLIAHRVGAKQADKKWVLLPEAKV